MSWTPLLALTEMLAAFLEMELLLKKYPPSKASQMKHLCNVKTISLVAAITSDQPNWGNFKAGERHGGRPTDCKRGNRRMKVFSYFLLICYQLSL